MTLTATIACKTTSAHPMRDAFLAKCADKTMTVGIIGMGYVGLPLALGAVTAAALADLGLTPGQGEMLCLLLRLPGAAAHALEQGGHGYAQFPFGAIELRAAPNLEEDGR